MEISARNQLKGTIKSLRMDNIMAEVVIEIGTGEEIVSVITRGSAEGLHLKVGDSVVTVIKATEVMVGKL